MFSQKISTQLRILDLLYENPYKVIINPKQMQKLQASWIDKQSISIVSGGKLV